MGLLSQAPKNEAENSIAKGTCQCRQGMVEHARSRYQDVLRTKYRFHVFDKAK